MSNDFDYAAVGGRRLKLGKGGSEVWSFGWIPPENRTQEQEAGAAAATALMPRFAIGNAPSARTDDPKRVEAYKIWKHPQVVQYLGFGPDGWLGTHQFSGSCFPAGTPVRMADGAEKPVEAVTVGDKVVTHTGASRRVVETMRRNFCGQMIKVALSGFPFPLEMTNDHQVAVWREENRWNRSKGRLGWVRADEISEGDRLILSLPNTQEERPVLDVAAILGERAMVLDDLMGSGDAPVSNVGMAQWVCRKSGIDWSGRVKLVRARYENTLPRYVRITPSFSRLVGLYLAEGGTDEGRVTFSLNANEVALADEIISLLSGIFGATAEKEWVPERPNNLKVRCGHTTLAAFFEAFCPGNVYSKRVPPALMSCDDEVRLALLMGWLAGDGHEAVTTTPGKSVGLRIQGVTASPDLARDMTVLALACGLRASACKRKPRKHSGVAYDVYFGGPRAKALCPTVAEAAVLAGAKVGREGDSNRTLFGYLRRVTKVERRTVEDLPVFDFEVEEDHSFVAGGVTVHNCVWAGGQNVITTLHFTDIILRNEFERLYVPFGLLAYGRSRYYLGDRSPGEGSTGSTFARAAREDGFLDARAEGMPTFKSGDGIEWGRSTEMSWSDGDAAQTMNLLPESRKRLVRTTAQCRDHNDVREALRNLYPCTCASMYAHDGGRVQGEGDDKVLLARRQGSWAHQMCLAPDTKVSLLDGSERTLKDIADAGKPVWVYSYDHATGRVVPKQTEARMTRPSSPEGMVRVTLDNGESVTATPDHRFLLRDGSWKDARDLRPGDSLMPLYRRKSTDADCKYRVGYEMLADPGGDWAFTHKRVAEAVQLVGLRYKDTTESETAEPGSAMAVIHHRDFNKLNNDPANLVRMLKQEHWRLHADAANPSHMWKARNDPDYNRRQAEAARKAMSELRRNPAFLSKLQEATSASMKRRWADPFFQKQVREAASRASRLRWENPEFREEQRQKRRGKKKSEEGRAKIAEGVRKKATDPEWLAKCREAAQKRSANPEYRRKLREACKEREARKRAIAPNNHKVTAVLFLPCETGPTYCLKVDGTENFAVSAGVFVHNSMLAWWEHPRFGELFYLMNQWGQCYDTDTEVLTNRGWFRFEDVPAEATYATLNPDTHHLEYQQATQRHHFDYNGYLHHFGSRDVDLMVTSNHRMYIHKVSNKRPDDPKEWDTVNAEDCPGHFRMKKDAYWVGTEQEWHRVGKHLVPMDDWLEFLGYYLSKGHARARRQRRIRRKTAAAVTMGITCRDAWEADVPVYPVKISQNSGAKADRMGKLLGRLPWRFTPLKQGWVANNKSLVAELEGFGKSYEKYLPEYVKGLSRRQLNILLDAMMLGDGSQGPRFGAVYYTSSKRLADDVQELCLKLGTPADVHTIDRRGREQSGGVTRHLEYHVKIKRQQRTPVCTGGWKPLLVPYKDKVWCVTVPNGLLYVRRNGKAVWSGNSAHGICPTGAPPGGVWITAADVDWICRDEVFAFSQYDGFPSQNIPWVFFEPGVS